MSERWSTTWPTEPGWYWFAGYRDEFSVRSHRHELIPINVKKGGSGFPFYVAGGSLLYKSQGAFGLWHPMEVPEIPTEMEIRMSWSPPGWPEVGEKI
jgi:hypothetical protein